MESSLDFLASVLEEVALEGLDGITLSTLWVRLENRPHFPLALDDGSKSFIWECIAVHKDIEMYQLPEPRPTLKLHDRFQYIDEEFGMVTEPAEKPDELYPLHLIEDGNVRGSCSTYNTRIRVTSLIRHGTVLLMSFSQTVDKWPDSIVLVSSVKSRFLALVGTEVNPLLELTKEQYVLLERIGRSRYHGEVSQGESGLLALNLPSVKNHLHYHSTKLINKGLITKQKHILRTKGGKTVSGSLFHLTRFYIQRKVRFDGLLEYIYNSLKNKPGNREISKKLQEEMGLSLSTFRKLLKRFAQKWFRLAFVPYREMYPDATDEECMMKNGQEKQVKVIQMIKPYVEEEEHVDDEEENNVNPYFDPSKLLLDKPVLSQVNDFIIFSGPNGATLADIRNALTLPKLDVRALCRQLVRRRQVITIMQDKGRQRCEKYIAKKFELESASYLSIKEQTDKFNSAEMNDDHISLQNSENDELNLCEKDGTSKVDITKNRKADENAFKKTKYLHSSHPEVIEVLDGSSIAPKKVSARMQSFVAAVNATLEGNEHQLSDRLLKRATLVVAFIKRARVTTVNELSKLITEEEKKEGYNYRIDKKSILRLIHRLCKDKYAKVIITSLKQDDSVKELQFICHPTVLPSDVDLKTAVDQAKFKHFCSSKGPQKESNNAKKLANKHCTEINKKREAVVESNKENDVQKHLAPLFARQAYGSQPKFVRTKALHLYLAYLVYHYEGELSEEQENPPVYHKSNTWKRFVPPLPQYKTKEGWCVLADAIGRMPLSVFVKIVNIKHEVPLLEDVLKDLTKQHYLVKDLPQNLRNDLFGSRRYVFMIHQILCKLCYMGLVSLGPRLHFEKDQVHVFVHRKAQIKDTSISPPGYMQIDSNVVYEVKEYEFQSYKDVEKYWIDLETTCLHTQLGKYSIMAGQKVTILDSNQKPELIKALQNKKFEDVADVDGPPGDGLGAAGLDSSLYGHLHRNWVWPTFSYKVSAPSQKSDLRCKNGSNTLQYLLCKSSKNAGQPATRVRLQRLTKQVLVPSKKRARANPDTSAPPPKKMKTVKMKEKKIRTVMHKCLKPRRPVYDEKDKVAMKSMKKLRVDWSAQEDSLLLMCKVASLFLDPHWVKVLVVPYTIVRDVLHKRFPHLSSNKTSRACQRRLRHMLVTSEEARCSVSVFLGEARQDSELVQEFNKVKPPRSHEEVWKTMFVTLLDKLLKKFTSSEENKIVSLPETVSALKSKYDIIGLVRVMKTHYEYQEPECDDDVYNAVICAIILSSLSSMKESGNWTYTLFKIYEQYPESMLRMVIDQLYKKHAITKHSRSKDPKFIKRLKHLTTVPYRFTVTYENSFLTKYPRSIHTEATELVTYLNSGEVSLDVDIPAGYISALLAYVSCNKIAIDAEIPKQIIVVDKDKQRSSMIEEMVPSLTTQESHDSVQLLNAPEMPSGENELESFDQKAKRKKLEIKDDDSSLLPQISTKTNENEDICMNLPNITYSSRLVYYILQNALSGPKTFSSTSTQDFVSLNPCNVYCEVTASAEPNCLTCLLPSKLVSNDDQPYQDVNCLSSFFFEEKTKEIIGSIVSSQSFNVPSELLTEVNYIQRLHNAYERHTSSPIVLHEGQNIFETICGSERLGISHVELWKKFKVLKGEITFFTHLDILMESRIILRVGVANYRYVGVMHSRPWLLSSFVMPKVLDKQTEKRPDTEIILTKKADKEQESLSNSEALDRCTANDCASASSYLSNNSELKFGSTVSLNAETGKSMVSFAEEKEETDISSEINDKLKHSSCKPVLFIPRTWKKPDGSLNNTVFITLLRSVLCYIMSAPGVTEENVCKRFSLPLQPIQTLELLEVLEKLFCIFKYYSKPPKRSSAFSLCNQQTITLNPEPDDIIHYESHGDAVVKLTMLSDALFSSEEE